MDFFESQDRARKKTGWLVIYFGLAILVMNLVIYAAAVMVFVAGRGQTRVSLWQPQILLLVVVVTCSVIVLGSIYKTMQLRLGGGVSVATMLGGQLILPNTTNQSERRLLNVVEEMALAAGVAVPPVYVLEDEQSINAFAAGFTPGDAVIGVNRGTLRLLNRDELQGVIAHEFSHILHGDMRLNIKLIGLLNGILLVASIGYFFMRFGGGTYHSSRRDKNSGHLALMGLVVFVVGYIGLFFARLIKAAIARQREYLADASAVQYTRSADGLCGALKKIGGLAMGSRMSTPNAEAASHMFFGSFRQNWFQAFATHPPLIERVTLLDPQFDGKFPVVEDRPPAPVRGTQPPAQPTARAPFDPLTKVLPTFGAARIPLDPAVLLAIIGTPNTNHVAIAQQIIGSLPDQVRAAVHEPFAARLVVLAVLLDHSDEVKKRQLELIEERLGERAALDTAQLAPIIRQHGKAVRLPLIEIVQSTLRQLSPDQYREFRDAAEALIHADDRVDLFEFTVLRTLLTRLDRIYEKVQPPRIRYLALRGVLAEAGELISMLVHVGHRDDDASRAAFDLASKAFSQEDPLPFLPRAESSLDRLHATLDKLAASSPLIKKRLIRAASLAVASDGQVTAEEAELLRAIADSLDCPVPPLFAGELPTNR